MIELDWVEFQYFMPFGTKQRVPLRRQGIIRLEGINRDEAGADSNMAGKSSLLEAILWCFFGRTIRGLRHDAVVHRHHRRNCYIRIRFRVHDTTYTVARYRRHKQHKNQLQLWRGDHLVSARKEEETQIRLEHILGCDYSTFTNTAVFGGTKSFALLTDAEQKKVLESFLGFSKFEAALQWTRDRITEAKNSLYELEKLEEGFIGRCNTLRGRLSELQSAASLFNRDAKKGIEETRLALSELKKPKRGPSRKKLRQEERVLARFEDIAARHRAKIELLREKIRTTRHSLRSRESLIGKPCPTCGQKFSRSRAKGFLKHLRAEGVALREDLTKSKARAAKWYEEVTHGRARLKRLTQITIRHRDQLKHYRSSGRGLRVKLAKLRAPRSPFSEKIERLQAKYSRSFSRLLTIRFEHRTLRRRLGDLMFWEIGFGNKGVKALIVRDALPTLNKKLAEYAGEIFGRGIKLELRPSKTTKTGEQRELFHLHYESRYGSGSYLGESAGGRRRVDICVLLVFSWLSRTCDVLVVDELLDGLDESGRDAVLSILSKLRGTVIVISHEKRLKSQLARVWNVEKHNGASILDTSP